MMRSTFRSVFVVNRGNLVGAFVIVVLATALLTATGAWLQAGWAADASGSGPSLLSTLASSFAGITLIIAIFIVASTFSTALRHRRREFALLRSIGATATQVRREVTGEVLVVTLAAAPLGAVAGVLLAPLLTPLLMSNGIVPTGFVLPFSPLAILATLVVLLPTALLAGRLAARESARLSPTAAVRESNVEPAAISAGRRAAALVLAIAGLLVAGAPLFLPGLLGAAAGAGSVLLLIIAAALAGPLVIGWLAARAARAATGSQAAVVLATVNARGFSRRNTAVILPLALLLCLGAVQSGAGIASAKATGVQLEKALSADLVVFPGEREPRSDARTVAELPGVTAVAQTSVVQASVRVEDSDADDLFALDALLWERSAIRTIAPAGSGLLDPGVVAGSLDDLEAAGTIAVSRDALLLTGKRLGDSIRLRLDGEEDSTARIVAIYENSIGVGDYLLAPGTGTTESNRTAVLVRTEPGAESEVRSRLEADGAAVTDAHGFAEAARTAGEAGQGLSNTLLLALLAFIAIAALQTLAIITSGRRAEFDLLRRTGATRSQIAAMITVESVFVVMASLALGILIALPALLGIGVGLVGDPSAAFDPIVFIGLAAVVVILPIVTMVSVMWRSTARQEHAGELRAA